MYNNNNKVNFYCEYKDNNNWKDNNHIGNNIMNTNIMGYLVDNGRI